ncbi:MAG: S8 family peptidase [Lachnospirales bacterium]
MAKAVQKVAPDVEFVIVKLKNAKNYYKRQLGIDENIPAFESSDLMLAIDYILKKSSEAKKPTSIVIGVGSNQGGHDGLNILESYLSQIAINNGISIITATGNEALSGRHTSFEINTDKGYEDVEINVGQNTKNFALWIWSDITDRVDIAIIPPLGNSIGRIEARNNFINTYKINITDTTVRVEYRIPLYRTSSQVTMIYVDKAVSGIWTIRVYGNTVLGKINCWLPITEFASDIKFLSPNVNTTLVTPSTAFNVMSVGGYDTISNKMIPSSGRGPTRDGRLKPDFVAPTNYSTRISASISAGVAALLLEWGIVKANNFNLNTISIKSYIMQGAVPLSSGDITPNNIWGYGAINLYNAFDKL